MDRGKSRPRILSVDLSAEGLELPGCRAGPPGAPTEAWDQSRSHQFVNTLSCVFTQKCRPAFHHKEVPTREINDFQNRSRVNPGQQGLVSGGVCWAPRRRRVAKGREWGAGRPEMVMEAHVDTTTSSEHRSLIGIHLPGMQPGCRVVQSPRVASGGERRYIPQSPLPLPTSPTHSPPQSGGKQSLDVNVGLY